MASAREHDQNAEAHELAAGEVELQRGPGTLACPDLTLNDQLTTGGIGRVTDWQPCWDVTEEADMRHRYAADAERRAAQRERQGAAQLARAEMAACRGIPEPERQHSVFAIVRRSPRSSRTASPARSAAPGSCSSPCPA